MEPRWLVEYRRSESRPRMNRISSRVTVIYKLVLPGFVFVTMGLWILGEVATGIGQRTAGELMSAVGWPLFVCVIGIGVFRRYNFRLADEVWDCGDTLLVRCRGRESQVPIAECVKLRYRGFASVPRVRILLRNKRSDLGGNRIEFIPPFRFFPFAMPSVVLDLTDRIDRASRKAEIGR